MSYPIFQVGEEYTLEEIKDILSSGEEIDTYMKGRFKYIGV